MKNSILVKCFLFYFSFALTSGVAQSSEHPSIWVTADDRDHILGLIENYDWAESIVHQLHQRVDRKMTSHQNNPDSILGGIPHFPAHNHVNKEAQAMTISKQHNELLALAADAGMLYYLTENDAYAMFSADILTAYIDVLAPREPQNTTVCGFAFFDARIAYGPFALAYDFIHSYLKRPDATAYNKELGRRIGFDDTKAQKAIANMVGSTLQEYGAADKHGEIISNHPILTAPGVLFGILCIEDDAERERLLEVFWKTGTSHQNSFKNTILPMYGNQGIWPESTSYSFMSAVPMILNILDRIYPEMNLADDYKYIFEGNFLFDNLRHPNRTFVRYGDSKRKNDSTENLYRYTLSLAKRTEQVDLMEKAQIALRQAYQARGGYHPRLTGNIFNNFEALQLFWGIPIPEEMEGSIDFKKPTVIIEHAGVALQRNYVEEANERYGLCGIIGGATYVHSHVTGITMELYGAEYVMAPNAGLPPTVPERKIPLHENYFRLYAGNNTVVVNGSSHGLQEGSWKDGAYVWQNTAINIAAEPLHLEDPISEYFSFATQSLNDEVNNAVQERTLSILRTSPTTGYYFDMFRSKSLEQSNQFHDYLYHNVGDETIFHDYVYHNLGDAAGITKQPGDALALTHTDRYDNDIGDPVGSPGWRFFEEEKSTTPTNVGVHVTFKINYDEHSMHMFIPSGVSREYTLALAPPSREARNGYVRKQTQVLAIRQEGEAWDRPYIAILEPSNNFDCSVVSVEPLTAMNNATGAKVISEVDGKTITDMIICQDNDEAIFEADTLDLYFKGRYGVVRQIESEGETSITMYIGKGELLRFNKHELQADDESGKGILVIEQTVCE